MTNQADTNLESTDKQTTHILHEKARNQHVKVSWNSVDEWGPAHDRTFHIKLSLTRYDNTEEYEGRGTSIKNAKRVAAATALKNSLLLSKITFKQNQDDPRKKCFFNLLNDIPDVRGPRAEIYELARVLHMHAKFHLVPMTTAKMPQERTPLRKIILHFGGRQYVGEASSRSGAEQEAALAALRAVKRALLSIDTSYKSKKLEISPSDKIRYIQPNNPTWRLKLLAALHFEKPIFKINEVTDSTSPSQFGHKRTYRCVCILNSYGTTEAYGPSGSLACKNASLLMLQRMLKEEQPSAENQEAYQMNDGPKKTVCSKNQRNLMVDRAKPTYGQDVHPITRLELVCFSNGLPSPSYVWQKSNRSTIGRSPEFCFTVHVGSEQVQGSPASNKRLARRLAAEAMLERLGFHKPSSPVPHGVLRRTSTVDSSELKPTFRTRSVDSIHSSEFMTTQHVQFSYARDVLLFESMDHTTFRFRGRPSRPVRSGIRSKTMPTDGSIESCSARGDEVSNTQSSFIGHWSDSQEAQTVSRRSRRVRSLSTCSLPAGSLTFHEDLLSPSKAVHDGINSDSNFPLLCQIASLRLEEPVSDTSTDLAHQLTTLCQSLRIPCQFTDRILTDGYSGISAPNENSHQTTLTVGLETPDNRSTEFSRVVVAEGAGSSLNVAREKAALSALRQMSALVVR